MSPSAYPVVALAPVPAGASARSAWERAWLSPAEASLLGPHASEKRRAEFVAGRLAAKAAAGLLLGPAWGRGDIGVLRRGGAATGPPRLALAGSCGGEIRVSISHADGIAVAAACRETVGIDLVAIEDHGPAFEADAFAPGELKAWRGWLGGAAARCEAAAVAFAAKEAALKWMGTGLTVPLQGVAVLPLAARASAGALGAGSAGLRVLKVNPGGGEALVTVPQARLRVSVVGPPGRTRPALSARILRLEGRAVFLLWGPDGPGPQN